MARERATTVTIVGDPFAKPMLAALDEAAEQGEPYDTSTLSFIVSSGVMFAAENKEALIDRVPQVVIADAIGSSEGGMGLQLTAKGLPVHTGRPRYICRSWYLCDTSMDLVTDNIAASTAALQVSRPPRGARSTGAACAAQLSLVHALALTSLDPIARYHN